MTAPHQDSRVEAALTAGLGKVVDAVVGAIPDRTGMLRAAFDELYRADALKAARSALLELLAAVGVDTSAHVRAPAVEVHVHRDPPHDTEAR